MSKNYLIIILCIDLAFQPAAYGDEIDDLKDLIVDHYESAANKIEEISKHSHKVAKSLIRFKSEETGHLLKMSLGRLSEDLPLLIESMRTCFNQLKFSELEFNSFQLQFENLNSWNFSYEEWTRVSTHGNRLMKYHSQCVRDAKKLQNIVHVLTYIQSKQFSICSYISKNLSYAHLLEKIPVSFSEKIKIDSSFYNTFPGLTLTIKKDMQCTASDTRCDDYSIESNVTEEGRLVQEENQDDWQRVRGAIPALSGSLAYYIGIYVGIGASASLGLGVGVMLVVAITVALVKNAKTKARVDELNKYIDKKESELRDIFAREYISRDQFSELKSSLCKESEQKLNLEIKSFYSQADLVNIERHLVWYSQTSTRLKKWYDDALIYLTTNKALLDDLVENRLEALIEDFYEPAHLAQTERILNTLSSKIREKQSEISLIDCPNMTSSSRFETRDFERKIAQYELACIAGVETVFRKFETQFRTPGSNQVLQCYYLGQDAMVSSLVIDAYKSNSALAKLLDDKGQVVAAKQFKFDDLESLESIELGCAFYDRLISDNKADFAGASHFQDSPLRAIRFNKKLNPAVVKLASQIKKSNGFVDRKVKQCFGDKPMKLYQPWWECSTGKIR